MSNPTASFEPYRRRLLGLAYRMPEGPVQTAAFEIERGVIRAMYVVRNSDKLRHLGPVRNFLTGP